MTTSLFSMMPECNIYQNKTFIAGPGSYFDCNRFIVDTMTKILIARGKGIRSIEVSFKGKSIILNTNDDRLRVRAVVEEN